LFIVVPVGEIFSRMPSAGTAEQGPANRTYLFLDGAPAGCTRYPSGFDLKGAVTVTSGAVLYHEGATDELVWESQAKPYRFWHVREGDGEQAPLRRPRLEERRCGAGLGRSAISVRGLLITAVDSVALPAPAGPTPALRTLFERQRLSRARYRMITRFALYVVGGGALGFLYYRIVGCRTGTCPITANPYISTMYGALLGYLLSGGLR
jgi:hypothetical protein